MKKIDKYFIEYAFNDSQLVHRVNEAIKEGWQPLGRSYFHGEMCYQTMVKYEEIKKTCSSHIKEF